MRSLTRREFLQRSAVGTAAVAWGTSYLSAAAHSEIPHGDRAAQDETVTVLNPQGRVPLSFIIDDSTCLVNMGHFCTPQFAAAWPGRYNTPWQTWPREIPDTFVREFGEWCAENGVKGKYSIVPYPACVGWMDRELPGWSRKQLQDSLKLVRTLMVPNWDIHPEMITHTRVINLKTGRPLEEISSATMENSYPQEKKSVDELAAYLAYALRILKNCELPCEGVTTPGGFGNLVKPELSRAVFEAVRDVYGTDLPHYFKYVVGNHETTAPQVEFASGLGTDDVRATVNVVAGTGDWFGGWDGDSRPEPDRYATKDASAGRLVDLILRGEPAVFLCHWPGMYSHGSKAGFKAFQQVVTAINSRFSTETLWMKVSEIGRYWTAKELTQIQRKQHTISFEAPFDCPNFTLQVEQSKPGTPTLTQGEQITKLREVQEQRQLSPGTWMQREASHTVCFALPKGRSQLTFT